MTKKITLQEVSDLRKVLQQEIISLLKENGLTELNLEFDEESQSPTYVVDYCERHDSWYEKQVVAVGLCTDGDWYLKVYDNQEDEETTIYAGEQSLATNNIDWLIGIRDNIKEVLKTQDAQQIIDLEYAELDERLNQVEQDIFRFMLGLLKEKGRISLNLSQEEAEDPNNFPVTTTLYGRHDNPRIRLTDVYLTEDGNHILVDGIDEDSGEKRKEFYIYSEQYADVFKFIGHCV